MGEEKLTLGQYFKQEREKLGLDLRQIEETTKISFQTLTFLENDEFDVLPPRAFMRGFLQVIAKEYGLDSEEMIRLLDEALAQHDKTKNESLERSKFNPDMIIRLAIGAIVALVIIFAALFIFSRNDAPEKQSMQEQHTMVAYTQDYQQIMLQGQDTPLSEISD